ncbi:MAG: hypothetical protein J1F11_04080 [Oscillospiraceae bacterium]|nr:hypothetical protein [Oscillospiraceae bacterium]
MKKISISVLLLIFCISALTSCVNDAGENIADTSETTETTADETAEAILSTLTDKEKEVWLSMPDIVTIRLLRRYNGDDGDLYSEFLYTEVIYIDKTGQVKKFISPDKLAPSETECTVEWIHDQISRNEDAELINTADIHKLIKFYNTLTYIDPNSRLEYWGGIGLAEYIERHYWFEIFGIRSDGGKNIYEVLEISEGDAGDYSIQHNYIEKRNMFGIYEKKNIDTYGRDTFNLYLELDPFMVDRPGGVGHLTGEEG